MTEENNSSGGVDPRRIRKKGSNQLRSDMLKGFSELEKAEKKQKGEGVYYNKKQDFKKEYDKQMKQLEYAPFDHDRKSRAASRPIPILKEKLVPDDLKTPEAEPKKFEKITFAKNVRHRKRDKFKTRQKEKK